MDEDGESTLDIRDLDDKELEYILDTAERGLDELKAIGPRTSPAAFYSLMFVKNTLEISLGIDDA